MKYFIKAASGKEYEINITENGDGGFNVTRDGESFLCHISKSQYRNHYSFICNKKKYKVEALNEKNNWELTLQDRQYSLDVFNEILYKSEKLQGKRSGTKLPPIIKTEMPGVVIEVMVTQNQKIEQGDVLIVVESMKMQNEILAPADALVENIFVAAGQQCDSGDKLIQLKYAGTE